MSAGELLRQANHLKRSGKLDEAIALYHQVIDTNSHFAWAYHNLGDALVKQGKLDEAVTEYRRAIEINPNSAWFYINLGLVFIQQDCLDEAIHYLRQGIQIKHDLLLNDKDERCASNLSTLAANTELFPNNINLQEGTQTQWQFDDLDSLAKLTPETLQNHPDRAKLAVLVAVSHLRRGEKQVAQRLIELALDWGLSKQNISQILISSLHDWVRRSASFTKVRTSWYIGDWEALVQLDKADLFNHPERAKLALLAAVGYQQLGNINAVRRCTDLALKWGCSHNLVYRALISGIYNLLGRGTAAAHRYKLSLKYFKSALTVMEIVDNPQRILVKSRVKKQIEQIPFLNTHKVINLVLKSDQ